MLETTPTNQIDNLVFALSIVILVIIFCASLVFFLKRRFNLGVIRQKFETNKHLCLVETLNIDQKRKLILIQKDNSEYLMLTGGPTDLLIATSSLPTTPIASVSATETPMPMTKTKELTKQGAADFFDQTRDRVFSKKDTETPIISAKQKTFTEHEPNDFQTMLEVQKEVQKKALRKNLTDLPKSIPELTRGKDNEHGSETSKERVEKLKALLDKAQQFRNRKH